MADFPIQVTFDPKPASAGLRQLDRQLAKLERRADKVRAGLANLSIGGGAPGGIASGASGIGKIGKQAEESSKSVFTLRNGLLALGGAQVVGGIVRTVDAFGNLQNRLRLVTNGTEELEKVTGQLLRISNATRSSFEDTTETFVKVSLAAKNLGVSQQETLRFTESLNKAVILSGVSSQAASAGLVQFAQGLGSGALRGDELRSVLEQLPRVAGVIADSLGVTRTRLREMGAEGKITSDIILDAFEKSGDQLDKEFGQTIPTIGQAFQVLRNQVVSFVGALDQATGISQVFVGVITLVGDNLNLLVNAAKGALLIFGPRLVGVLKGALIPVLLRLSAVIKGQVLAAVLAFNIALSTGPTAVITLALRVLLPLLFTFTSVLEDTVGAIISWARESETVQAVLDALAFVVNDLAENIGKFVTQMEFGVRAIGKFARSIGPLRSFFKLAEDLRQQRLLELDELEFLANARERSVRAQIEEAAVRAENLDAQVKSIKAISDTVDKLILERQALKLSNEELAVRDARLRATAAASKDGIKINAGALALLEREVRATVRAKAAADSREKSRRKELSLRKALRSEIVGFRNSISDLATAQSELIQIRARLRAALERGIVTGREAVAIIKRETEARRGALNPFKEQIDQISLLNTAVKAGAAGADRAVRIQELYNQKLAAGAAAGDKTRETVTLLVDEELRLSGAVTTANDSWERQRSLLETINAPATNYAQRIADLNILLGQGAISQAQFENEVQSAKEALESANNAALPEAVKQQQRLAEQTKKTAERFKLQAVATRALESQFSSAFGSIVDELVEFAFTGEQAFKQLFTNIAKQLAALTIKLLAFQALKAGLTASGAGPGAGALAGRLLGLRTGGSFQVAGTGGPDSQVAAFRVTPGETVSVTTPRQTRALEAIAAGQGAGGAPQAPINIINSTDPDEMANFINSPAGGRAIVNAINSNPQLRRALRG